MSPPIALEVLAQGAATLFLVGLLVFVLGVLLPVKWSTTVAIAGGVVIATSSIFMFMICVQFLSQEKTEDKVPQKTTADKTTCSETERLNVWIDGLLVGKRWQDSETNMLGRLNPLKKQERELIWKEGYLAGKKVCAVQK